MSVARQSSTPFATPPELNTQISSVAAVVVSEIAYIFARFEGVKVKAPFVAESVPDAVVSVRPALLASTNLWTVAPVAPTSAATPVCPTIGLVDAVILIEETVMLTDETVSVLITVTDAVILIEETVMLTEETVNVFTIVVEQVILVDETVNVFITVTEAVMLTEETVAFTLFEEIVPVIVTVPNVAEETFIFPATTFVVTVPVTVVEAVMLVEETVAETEPPPIVTTVFETVTAVLTRETFTGFPTALLMVDEVFVMEIVPTVRFTRRYPLASIRSGRTPSSAVCPTVLA